MGTLFAVVEGIGALRTHASSAHGSGTVQYRLEGRHARLFSDGVARLRKGFFPVTENGRPKKLSKATPPEEVEAVRLVWLQKIEALRCLVMDREDYKHRFMSAAADGTLDVDLCGDLVIDLNEPDRLCLITDGGTPYTPYPSRIVPVVNATWDEEAGVFVGDLGYL